MTLFHRQTVRGDLSSSDRLARKLLRLEKQLYRQRNNSYCQTCISYSRSNMSDNRTSISDNRISISDCSSRKRLFNEFFVCILIFYSMIIPLRVSQYYSNPCTDLFSRCSISDSRKSISYNWISISDCRTSISDSFYNYANPIV